jgi:hypothetical protein
MSESRILYPEDRIPIQRLIITKNKIPFLPIVNWSF